MAAVVVEWEAAAATTAEAAKRDGFENSPEDPVSREEESDLHFLATSTTYTTTIKGHSLKKHHRVQGRVEFILPLLIVPVSQPPFLFICFNP